MAGFREISPGGSRDSDKSGDEGIQPGVKRRQSETEIQAKRYEAEKKKGRVIDETPIEGYFSLGEKARWENLLPEQRRQLKEIWDYTKPLLTEQVRSQLEAGQYPTAKLDLPEEMKQILEGNRDMIHLYYHTLKGSLVSIMLTNAQKEEIHLKQDITSHNGFKALRHEIHDKIIKELNTRIRENPVPTGEEYSLGAFYERIEPQLQPTVHVFFYKRILN